MVKAIFIDYTGTIITQGGKDAEEMVYRVCKNSDMKNPNEFLKYWWGMIKEYEASFEGTTYVTEDEIVNFLGKHWISVGVRWMRLFTLVIR